MSSNDSNNHSLKQSIYVFETSRDVRRIDSRITPYHATSLTSSWEVYCARREFIAVALSFRKVSSCLRTLRDVTAAFGAIERESTKVGLAVNEGKTRYMFSTSRDVRRRVDSRISVDNYTQGIYLSWLRRYHQK